MLYTGKSILDVANEHNFAIPAFNISDWAMFNGVMDISEEKQAPVIIAIHPDEVSHITTDLIARDGKAELTLHMPGAGSYTVPALTRAASSTFTSWGAEKQLAVYDHPVNEALSNYLEKPVALAFAPRQNLVYAGAFSLIGTATLVEIARQLNPEQPLNPDEIAARLRCNLVVETSTPYIEDRWQGKTLTLQAGRGVPAELHGLQLVAGESVGRCAVIDVQPDTGLRTARLLKLLASYRPRNLRGEPTAGIYASLAAAAPGLPPG